MSSGMTSLAGAAVRLRDVNVTNIDTRQYKFDIFAILHPTRKPILPPDTRIHHFDTYINPQQLSVRLRHTCVYRLISPKSVGASSLIVSCHFITDIIFRTDCDVTMCSWRHDALRCVIILHAVTKIFCSVKSKLIFLKVLPAHILFLTQIPDAHNN